MATLTVDDWALHEITLDYANQFVPDIFIANANDIQGRGIDLHVTKDGSALDMSGMTVYLAWRHENGNQDLTEFSAVSASSGHYRAYFPNAMMHGGMVLARIAVYVESSIVTGSRDFRIRVEPNPIDEDEAMADENFQTFQQAVVDLNEATGTAESAATKANAAAASADVATTATRDAATSIMNAISEITDSYLSETASGIVDTLARNSCTSGMYLDGTWYVDSSDVSYSDGVLTVEGASYSGGYMLLPTETCCAAEALSTAQRAEEEALEASRLASYNSSSVEDLMAQIEALQAMVDVLALNAYTYPFVVGTTMYVRNVSYSDGILTLPDASYSDGRMVIGSM